MNELNLADCLDHGQTTVMPSCQVRARRCESEGPRVLEVSPLPASSERKSPRSTVRPTEWDAESGSFVVAPPMLTSIIPSKQHSHAEA